MKKFCINKLVRDKEIEWIRQNQGKADYAFLDGIKKSDALKEKLTEEVDEFLRARTVSEQLLEIADILSVLKSLMETLNLDFSEAEEICRRKEIMRGGFDKGIYLHDVVLPEEAELCRYYLKNPDSYPEAPKK